MTRSKPPRSNVYKAVALARAHADGRVPPLRSTPRIVVAEDDIEMRRIVVEAVREDGYEVHEAADGGRLLVDVSARFCRDDAELDLVISDVRMPICTGLEILTAMREAGWTVPVILMTAFADRETRVRAESLGALLFDKPFSIDDLRTAVVNLLPRR